MLQQAFSLENGEKVEGKENGKKEQPNIPEMVSECKKNENVSDDDIKSMKVCINKICTIK